MEFWQYYRVVRRRRWVFLVVALVTLGTVLYAYQPLPAGYAATASIKADSTAPLVSVLNSRTVLAATAEQLHVSPRALEGRFVVREDREAGVVRVMALGTTPEGAERAGTAFGQAGMQGYERVMREGRARPPRSSRRRSRSTPGCPVRGPRASGPSSRPSSPSRRPASRRPRRVSPPSAPGAARLCRPRWRRPSTAPWPWSRPGTPRSPNGRTCRPGSRPRTAS